MSMFRLIIGTACSVDTGNSSIVALFKDSAGQLSSNVMRQGNGRQLDVAVTPPGGVTGNSKTLDIDLSTSDLTKTQRAELLALLHCYSDRFSINLSNIGRSNVHECKLPTTGKPLAMKIFYHYPIAWFGSQLLNIFVALNPLKKTPKSLVHFLHPSPLRQRSGLKL